jgi:CubicO group peptidase (beta-lactamase class C family)
MKRLLVIIVLQFVSSLLFAQDEQQKMDELLSAYNQQNKFSGVVLVAKGGNIIIEKGYGYRNVAAKIPHEVNDIFVIASNTKQITAAAVMKLQEEGKLSVQDKLSNYYPDFPNASKITIEELLTHTSGIYNNTNDTVLMRQDPTQHFTEAKAVGILKAYPLDFEPGTKFNYSNSGYILLGYIIAKAAKKPYEQVVREKIFQPLGMTHSGFDFTNLNSPYKSTGYVSISKNNAVPAPIIDSTIGFSTSSIYSTVEDLYKWERGIATDKILNPESWKKVFTPHFNKYGYGWVIDTAYGKLLMEHSGITSGFTSDIIRFPQDGAVVIVLDNSTSGFIEGIAKDLAAIVFHQPYTLPEDIKGITLSTAVLQKYVGKYQDKNGVSGVIRVEGDHLLNVFLGNEDVELYPQKDGFFLPKGHDGKVEFVKDSSGKVIEQIIYRPNFELHYKKVE